MKLEDIVPPERLRAYLLHRSATGNDYDRPVNAARLNELDAHYGPIVSDFYTRDNSQWAATMAAFAEIAEFIEQDTPQ